MSQTLHIYTRVSTDAQEENGTSLGTQKDLGIKKADELGFSYKVWNEGGASSNYEDFQNRPVLLSLLQEIEEGKVQHLWVYNNDRLSRNDMTQHTIRLALQKHGVTLYTQSGQYDLNNPNDKLIKTILDGIAQFDNALRAERTRLGKLNRVKQGYWMGGPPPFGYKIENKKLVLHPEESKWVKKIYEWYSDHKSVQWIKGELDKNGVRPRRENGTWTLGSIQKMLQNSHPKGFYTYLDSKSSETIRCECPSIVTASLWNKCQDTRKKILARKGQNNRTKHFYMLRNLLYCGHCGSHMSGRIKESKYERLYYCPHKEREWVKNSPEQKEKWVRGKGCDMTRSLNIDATDQLIWDTVVNVVSNAFKAKFASSNSLIKLRDTGDLQKDVKMEQNSLKRLKKELANIEKNIANVETNKLLGKQDHKIAKQVLINLYDELSRTKAKLEQAKFRVAERNKLKDFNAWFENMQTDREKLRSFSKEQKRDYLHNIIEKIEVFWDNEQKIHTLHLFFILKKLNDNLPSGSVVKTDTLKVDLKKNDKICASKFRDAHPPTSQIYHGGVRGNAQQKRVANHSYWRNRSHCNVDLLANTKAQNT